MNATTDGTSRRALVLHGGGSAGNAWEIGVVAGLLAGGIDVTAADLIIGTSAGATAAAQITAADPAALFARVLDETPSPSAPPTRPRPAIDHLERTNRIIAQSTDAADMRRRIGAAAVALEADSDGSGSLRWRAITAARLPSSEWPNQRVLITAVDARTGEPVVFDRGTGTDLADAIAASTSSGVAYRIGDDLFIDGGYRRNENADLATGYEHVLVLSPFGGQSRHPLEWGMQLAAQVDELRVAGSRVETISPDAASLAAFSDNMMDLSTRPSAARAGYAQGRAAAANLAIFWR